MDAPVTAVCLQMCGTIIRSVKTDKFTQRPDKSNPSSKCQQELQLLRVTNMAATDWREGGGGQQTVRQTSTDIDRL